MTHKMAGFHLIVEAIPVAEFNAHSTLSRFHQLFTVAAARQIMLVDVVAQFRLVLSLALLCFLQVFISNCCFFHAFAGANLPLVIPLLLRGLIARVILRWGAHVNTRVAGNIG